MTNPYLARRDFMRNAPLENFFARIKKMNRVMQIGVADNPTNLGRGRLEEWRDVLLDEMDELDDVIALMELGREKDALVALADFIGDNIVYHTSEACRWGIPIVDVLDLIMDSQDSKLVNGQPVPGEMPGKFGKGPDYQPPEPAIKKLLFGDEEECNDCPDMAEQMRYWAAENGIDSNEAEDALGNLMQRLLRKTREEDDGVNYEKD